MRSQFNEQGTSYHLLLNPVLHPAITIDVPSRQGTLIQTPRGVVAGDVDATWWSTRIQNLNNSLSYADPTHLQLYLTDNTMLFTGDNPRPEWHERPVHLHGRPQPIPRLPRPPAGLPGLSSPLCLGGPLAGPSKHRPFGGRAAARARGTRPMRSFARRRTGRPRGGVSIWPR
jgi:hypothetical protein